jgi:hypothetical protein
VFTVDSSLSFEDRRTEWTGNADNPAVARLYRIARPRSDAQAIDPEP